MTKTNFNVETIYIVDYCISEKCKREVCTGKQMSEWEISEFLKSIHGYKDINIKSIKVKDIDLNLIFKNLFGDRKNENLNFSYTSKYHSLRCFLSDVEILKFEIDFEEQKDINLKVQDKNGEWEWITIEEGSVIVYNNKEEYQKAFVQEFLKENDINKDILKEI